MIDAIDTRMLSLDKPLPEGVIKMLDESAPWDADLSQETSDITSFGEEHNSLPLKPIHVTDRPIDFYEWLWFAARRAAESQIRSTILILLLSLEKVLVHPQWTFAVDPHLIFEAVSDKKSPVVSVSPSLIMPRSEVHASSLLAPSGAYLTWLEMLAEEADAQSQ